MGMFSSLFGATGSDKADKLRQQAMDAFNSVKTPELSSLQIQLQKAVVAGTITPEQAETQLLNSNAFNQIKTDPSLVGAQKQALQALQDTASAGGLDAIDKSKLQDIRDQQEQENSSSNGAIMDAARARGTGNSNLTSVQQLIAEQGAANRASRSGTDVAALAQARALEALKAAGTQASNMQSTDFNQQAAKATAQNDIDKFNAANKTDISKFNTTNDLNAQGANVANAQHVEDANTATKNAEIAHNANANQTVYDDQLRKAEGQSGILNNWANDATKAHQTEQAGDAGLLSGAISAGAKAAGPIAGAFSSDSAPTAAASTASTDMGYMPKTNNPLSLYNQGGEVEAPSEKPEGSLEDEYNKFVQNFCNGGTVNMADGGKVTVKPGKKDQPVTSLPIKSAENEKDWSLSDPNNQPIGDFSNYSDAADFAAKVKEKQPDVKDYLNGGKVPGKPVVQGDSPKNDIVPAKLSPGEVVIPRTDVAALEKKIGDPLTEALKRLKNSPQVGSVRG